MNKNIHLYLFYFLIVILTNSIAAQTIGTPKLGFTSACAGNNFNEFKVTVTFSDDIGSDENNKFILELSDGMGNFNRTVTLYTFKAGEFKTSPATLVFALPSDAAGENYKVRVKSTSPVATSAPSLKFPGYFKSHDSPFTINKLVENVTICPGAKYTLEIDNPGEGNNDSPLKYENLSFKWYLVESVTSSKLISNEKSITVSEPGIYYVITNYGSCISNSYSNRVTISTSNTGGVTTISSSLGANFCLSEGETTLTTTVGDSYKWYKNEVLIPGATSQTYKTDKAATYRVEVDKGGCISKGTITIEIYSFTAQIDVDTYNEIKEGESLIVTAITSINKVTYQWYKDNIEIPAATLNTYTVTESGMYKLIVTHKDICVNTVELPFEVVVKEVDVPAPPVEGNDLVIPNIVSPNGDGFNDTWILPDKYTKELNAEVFIYNAIGKVVFHSNSYQNNWPETELIKTEFNTVYYYIIKYNSEKIKGSITILK